MLHSAAAIHAATEVVPVRHVELVDVVISTVCAVKPAVTNGEALPVVSVETNSVNAAAVTVLACSMVSAAVATTLWVDRFRRRVKTV